MAYLKQTHCNILGCPKPHLAKGLCRMHYYRLQRTGTTDEAPPREAATCSAEGCPSVVKAKGLCNRHYQQVKNSGAVQPEDNRTYAERFWERVDQSGGPEACWPWTGPLLPTGYVQAKYRGRNRGVHVIAWILANGEVPEGMEVDHRCHTTACKLGNECPHRRCANPLHLLPVPPLENRSPERCTLQEAAGAHQRAKTQCPAGHYYNETNTYITPRGDRHCRACNRDTAWRLRNGDHPRPQTEADRLALVPPGMSTALPMCPRSHVMDEANTYTSPRGYRRCRTCDRERAADRRRGQRPPRAKITTAQAAEIRARYAAGDVRQVDLAAEYGLSQSHISLILRGGAWT